MLVLGCLARTEGFFSNEGEKAKADDDHKGHASFSDFS
jgi:hypothetical protein